MVRSLLLALLLALPAFPSVIPYSFDLVTQTSDFTGIQVGDVFHLSFTIDFGATDTQASTGVGVFDNPFGSFSLVRDAGNTGTYDPSGGSFGASSNARTIPLGSDNFQLFFLDPSGFAPLDVNPCCNLTIFFLLDRNDTGAGQTLEQQLVGGIPSAQQLVNAFSSAGLGSSDIDIELLTTFTVQSSVPEPSSMLLLGAGLVALAGYGRARRRGRPADASFAPDTDFRVLPIAASRAVLA